MVDGENISTAHSAEWITIVAPSLAIAADKDSIKGNTDDWVMFTVSRTGNLDEALELVVTPSNPEKLNLFVEETVTIPAGESSVTFGGCGYWRDFEGSEQIAVTITADRFDPVETIITVMAATPAELVIESLVVEPMQVTAGTQINVSWVLRNAGDWFAVETFFGGVYITSTGALEDAHFLARRDCNPNPFISFHPALFLGGASMPFTVIPTIPLDYSGEYQIILVYRGQQLISNTITVVAPELSVTSDVAAVKDGKEDGVLFTVTRTGNLDEALELSVTSCNTSALTVPATVTIPAGESFVTFYGSSIRDFIKDGDKLVTVTVAAEYYVESTVEIVVLKVPPVDPVNAELRVPDSARPGSTIMVSWNVTNEGYMITSPTKWVDNIYLSPDGQIENAILVGSFTVDFELASDESRLRMESIAIPAGLTGDYCLIVQTVYDGKPYTPAITDLLLSDEKYSPRLVMPEQENVHWTIRRDGDRLWVVNEHGQVIFDDDMDALLSMEIVAPSSYNSDMTVDLSLGDLVLPEALFYIGNSEYRNSLVVVGTEYEDTFNFVDSRVGSQVTANGLHDETIIPGQARRNRDALHPQTGFVLSQFKIDRERSDQ
jgi:hypothetical protein